MSAPSKSFLADHAGLASALLVAGLLTVIMLAVPALVTPYRILQLTILAVMAIFALGQGFIWGFAGIMSFGQAAFLGLGGYAYAVGIINFGDSTPAIFLAMAVPMAAAALLGYFMFYGGISDAYVAAITLTVSVILYQLLNATSGSAYHVGTAMLGGFNGIAGVPPLNLPGDAGAPISQAGIWYASMSALLLCYLFLRAILATRFGSVIVAVRENQVRAQLLGYDARLYKCLAFIIGGAISGLAGCLYVNWAGYVNPDIFALTMSAQVMIFVLVGGLGTLVGPVVGAICIQYLIATIGDQQSVDPGVILGAILVVCVILIPRGLAVEMRDLIGRMRNRRESGLE